MGTNKRIITKLFAVILTLLFVLQTPLSAIAQNKSTGASPPEAAEVSTDEQQGTLPAEDEVLSDDKEEAKEPEKEIKEDNNKIEDSAAEEENKANQKPSKAISPRSTITGSKAISSIFPDPVLAQYMAGLLGKSVGSTVTQNNLNTITSINPSGAVHNAEGIQYLEGLKECRLDNLQLTEKLPYAFITDIYPGLTYYTANNQRYETDLPPITGTLESVYAATPPLFKQIAQNSNGKVVGQWEIVRTDPTWTYVGSIPAVDGTELLDYAGVDPGKYRVSLQLYDNIWMNFDWSIYYFNFEYKTKATGTLNGIITDAVTGAPIEGAKVTVSSGQVTDNTLSSATGYYIFSALDVRNYSVTVEKDGYYTQTKKVTIGNGVTTTLDFQLIPYYGSTEGLVIDAVTKEPIPGADVTPAIANTPQKTTDSTGHFYYTNVPAGTYTSNTSAAGYQSKSTTHTFTANTTNYVVIELDPLTYTLSGYVYIENTNTPINTATVTLPGGYTATTNASGYYQVANIPKGDYTATASASGYSTEQENVIIPADNYQNQTQDFYLTPNPGKINVNTYLNSVNPGNELADATITVKGTTITNEAIDLSVTTSATGTYTFELAPGTYQVDSKKAGYKVIDPISHPITVNLTASANESYNFVFKEILADITGTVYDKTTGDPINGATVTLIKPDGSKFNYTTLGDGKYSFTNLPVGEYGVLAEATDYNSEYAAIKVTDSGVITQDFYLKKSPGTLTAEVRFFGSNALVEGATAHLNDGRSDMTDVSGTVSAKLAPDNYTAYVTYNGYKTPSQSATLIANGNEKLVFYVYEGRALNGTVKNIVTGNPITGATVALNTGETTTTDASGHYYFQNLTQNTYTVTASKSGYQTSVHSSVSTPDNTLTTENFNLIPDLGAITGTVSYSSGTPAAGTTITLSNGDTRTTDTNGKYYFVETGGEYSVTETTAGYQTQTKPATVTFGRASVVDFVLQALPGTLNGKVTDSNGNPVAGVNITAYSKDNASAEIYKTTTDANGNYIFDEILADDYTVVASKSGYGTQAKDGTVITEETTTVNFVLPKNPGLLKGKVTYEKTGKPAKNATITIMPGNIKIKTDKNGYYEIPLMKGNYTVSMTFSGYKKQSKKAIVMNNQTSTANFILPDKDTGGNNGGSSGSGGSSKTGDSSNALLWITLMALSLGGLISIRKTRQHRN